MQKKQNWRRKEIGGFILSLVILISLSSCKTFQRGKTPAANSTNNIVRLGDQPEGRKKLIVRSPNLNKLKKLSFNTMKEEKPNNNNSRTNFIVEEVVPDDEAEEVAPANKFDMIMTWLAVVSGCGLVWASLYFFGRHLFK